MAARDDGAALAIGVPKVIVWWFALTALGAFVLAKTRTGNWILACGGDAVAAKNVGIPVARLKIKLFVFVALCAALFAVLQVADAGSAAADRGCRRSSKPSSPPSSAAVCSPAATARSIGAAIGALIFGMVQIGIGYTSIDNNWYRVFLGLMLLVAVLFNNFIRRRFALGKR